MKTEKKQNENANLEWGANTSEDKFLEGADTWSKEFLRVLRINWEYIQGFYAFRNVHRCVTVFGSARFHQHHPYYQMAFEVGRLLAMDNYTVMTGGGPGIMEAANRGAKSVNGRSIGCNIKISEEQHPNPYLDKWITFKFFFIRKVMLTKYSLSFVVMPGGFGTLDELFEMETLIQTGKIRNFPVVLMGKEYWQPLIDFMKNTLVNQGTIEESDMHKLIITDSAREAVDFIKEFTKIEPNKMNEFVGLQQTIFNEGDSYFKSLLDDIAAARNKIDLETYIFNPDSLGEQVAHALEAAAKRGVKVRVLVDGAGSPIWGGTFAKQLDAAGVQTRIFHPFPWSLWQWSRSHVNASYLIKPIYLLLKINSRNHRKVCTIDNKIAYIGSANISKVHLSSTVGGDNWRDTGIKITGINLSQLREAFNAAWEHLPIKERLQKIFRRVDRNPVIRLNNSRHRRRILYKNLLNRIENCQKRIWMTNAYFVPDNFLLKQLKDAAQRGLDVRILLPQKSDVFFMPWASAAFYRSLLKVGVRIFEYLPSMLHTKILILDDWIAVGSSNINHRSLLHDLEVDINIRTPTAKFEIEQQFLADLKNSQEVFLSQWYKRPWYQRFLGRLLLYVKYWI